MKTMQYVLKTGFGDSPDSYGGTATAPNFGLGQGSGASPPGFLALSSLTINAYQRMGHGAKILSSFSRQLFHLTAVMYFNDTDLLHWPKSSCINLKELVALVQKATTNYGCLAIALGGILKEKKCSIYFLDYKFVHGRAHMKSLHKLPAPQCYTSKDDLMLPYHTTIPQPVGPDLPILHMMLQLHQRCLVYTSLQPRIW
jgi:hypothetical protein